MRRIIVALALLGACLPLTAVPAGAEGCSFRLGFATLHDLIPDQVGTCLEDENHNPLNGDALQHTTGGLLVWRKADNWTAFTDGYHTWINGPHGLQERLNEERFDWEAPKAVPTTTLLDLSGTGVARTAVFNPPGPWDLSWSYDCHAHGTGTGIFDVYTRGAAPGVAADEAFSGEAELAKAGKSTEAGEGVHHFQTSGPQYLDISPYPECTWHITARG
jgi:hypothetical protein